MLSNLWYINCCKFTTSKTIFRLVLVAFLTLLLKVLVKRGSILQNIKFWTYTNFVFPCKLSSNIAKYCLTQFQNAFGSLEPSRYPKLSCPPLNCICLEKWSNVSIFISIGWSKQSKIKFFVFSPKAPLMI